MIIINEEVAISLHLEMAKVTGGDVGVRDAGLLDSALNASVLAMVTTIRALAVRIFIKR